VYTTPDDLSYWGKVLSSGSNVGVHYQVQVGRYTRQVARIPSDLDRALQVVLAVMLQGRAYVLGKYLRKVRVHTECTVLQ
jgi:hypothetical protein